MDFTKTVLSNGMTVYGKRTDVPYAFAWLYFPVGHWNNTGEIIPGTAHFLEHMCCNSSERYPVLDSYGDFVALEGGNTNAYTSGTDTRYIMKIPSDSFEEGFRGLVSRAFEPRIKEDLICTEQRVISNERRRKSIWHPGNSELSHHCKTKWKLDRAFDLRQMLGDDEDLEAITAAKLREFHVHYFDPRVVAILGGDYDEDLVFKELARFPTKQHNLPVKFNVTTWTNRQYHEVAIRDVTRFMYHLGGIVDVTEPLVIMALNFIENLLTCPAQGVLYRWLRKETGWVYNMGFDIATGNQHSKTDWELWLPLNNLEQVTTVRNELHGRIQDALHNQALIQSELRKRKREAVFWDQSVGTIASEAHNNLNNYQRIIDTREWYAHLERCGDPKFLQQIYNTYMSKEVTGEFLAIPGKS